LIFGPVLLPERGKRPENMAFLPGTVHHYRRCAQIAYFLGFFAEK
jgi:hypothetical protein